MENPINNKDKLIKTGSWLLHHFGFAGTSMDMLLKSSGVSASNFYYYFEGKEQFVSRVVRHLASEFEENFLSTTVLNLDLEPLERFNSFYAKATSYHDSLFSDPPYPGCFFGNLALEKSSIDEGLRSILQDFFSKWRESFRQCLKDGVEQGVFNEEIDPEAMANLLISQIEGAILLSKVHNSLNVFESSCSEIRKLVIKKEYRENFRYDN